MDEIIQMFQKIWDHIGVLERARTIKNLTFPADGKLVVPVMDTDPLTPTNGQMWVNSTSSQFKIRVGGVTKIVTLT